jgi:hypothetical protein
MHLKAKERYSGTMFSSTSRVKTYRKELASTKRKHRYFISQIAKKSFWCHFHDMVFHEFLSGRMIFLYGTSTAGKSSIVKYITLAKSKSLYLVVTGTDIVWGLHIFDLFARYLPQKASFLRSYFTIEEIFDCIWNPPLAMRLINEKFLSEQQGEQIKKIIDEFRTQQNELLKDFSPTKRPFFCSSSFLSALRLGATVIVDTAADVGDIDEFFRAKGAELVHCRTDIVMVYCSPKKLMERLVSRNEEALKTSSINKGRPGAFPLEQYSVIYEATNQPSQAIDTLTMADIEVPNELPHLCKILSELLSEQLATPNAYSEQEWTATQVRFQKWFDLNETNDRVYIKPKSDYQLVVNTGEASAEVCGEEIVNTLRL